MRARAVDMSAAQWQAAYISGDPEVTEFYVAPAFDFAPTVPGRLAASWDPLTAEEGAEWRALLDAHGFPSAQLSLLDKLRQGGTLAVVTGQQAGAALGPLYTLWKALAAVRWARAVEASTGRPCVPIFWVASDDHDLAEIDEMTWLGRDDVLRRCSLGADSPAGTPASAALISPEKAAAALEEFAQSLPTAEFLAPILSDLNSGLLRDRATFESQFLDLFNRWITPLGIIPLVPRLGFVRRRGAAVMRRMIEDHGPVSAALQVTATSLRAAGLPPPIHRKPEDANFFLELDGVRLKVVATEGGFIALSPESKQVQQSFTKEQLLALLETSPGSFSPNVVSRPLVQDSALPTVAYVGGPGEIAYHAQIGALYPLLGVTRPALMPRPGVALITPPLERALERLDIQPTPRVLTSSDALRSAIDQPRAHPTAERLAGLAEEFGELLGRADAAVADIVSDTGIAKASAKLRESTENALTRLRERVDAYLDAQDKARTAARDRVLSQLFPDGSPQERTVGLAAPLLANNGMGALALIAERLDLRADGTQAIRLASLAES